MKTVNNITTIHVVINKCFAAILEGKEDIIPKAIAPLKPQYESKN